MSSLGLASLGWARKSDGEAERNSHSPDDDHGPQCTKAHEDWDPYGKHDRSQPDSPASCSPRRCAPLGNSTDDAQVRPRQGQEQREVKDTEKAHYGKGFL